MTSTVQTQFDVGQDRLDWPTGLSGASSMLLGSLQRIHRPVCLTYWGNRRPLKQHAFPGLCDCPNCAVQTICANYLILFFFKNMPPPIDPSDEETSDRENSAPAHEPEPSSARSARAKKSLDHDVVENGGDDMEDEPQAVTGDVGEDEDEEADEDQEAEEEEYIVEEILDHAADKSGEVKFLVKWENYPAEEATWEPEENLVGSADEVLGHWEDHIARIDACEDEETNKLMIYLQWKNGQKTQHETKIVYQRCPQKMLQYYEQHVRIVKNPPERISTNGTPGPR
ncbi:hypothetical protein P8C59_008882 [Phyllachora maydis]|uniref:Chromo domain-containing protein n=1 Tax=Phyllachora maydis TaxID=1825666 RepID=A0AAD9ICD7_9PEZI|nr:hypothetical protein P8C59_008882 [Phyllachora maydis]